MTRYWNDGKIGMAAAWTFEWSVAAFEQWHADAAILQIVNPKGEMKGSAITGPVGKEAAELWPVFTALPIVLFNLANKHLAYCKQLGCRDVRMFKCMK